MKFLLDDDVPVDIVYSLVALGHQVTVLREALPITSPDNDVYHYAKKTGSVLVTCNRDGFLTLASQ